MATSDEQFRGEPPYHPDVTALTIGELLQAASREATRGVPPGPCLGEEEIALIAAAGANPAARTAAIAHLAQCQTCRRQLSALVALLEDPAIAAEVSRLQDRSRGSRRFALIAVGITGIAAALLLVVIPPRPDASPDARRDQTFPPPEVPAAIAPLGAVTRAEALTWSRIDGATSYRATLFDSAGTVLFEIQVADTTVAIPDSVRLVPFRPYFWKVSARTGWDRWAASQLFEFQVDSTGVPQAVRSVPDLVLASAAANPPEPLGKLAAILPDEALIREVRDRPVDVREAFRDALAGAVRGDSSSRATELRTARRLAVAYEAAWKDPFLARELDRFVAWTPAQRSARVWADSVRGAGVSSYGRDGPLAAIAVWRLALARARSIPDTAGTAALMGNIGAAFARESRPDSAAHYLTRARDLAERVGDLRVTANALSELGGLSEQRDDVAAARAQYSRAIEIRGRIGDSRGLAADYNNVASLSRAAGDVDNARRQLEAALALNRRAGRTTAAATNLVNLASLAAAVGALGRAEQDYREALAAWIAAGDSAEAASALNGLGGVNLRRGNYPAAVEHFTTAARILDRTGPVADALSTRARLATALAAQGRLQEAADELRRSDQIGEARRVAPVVRAELALARADLAAELNDLSGAERQYTAAATFYEQAGVPEGTAAARHGLGLLYSAHGNTTRATALLEGALRTQADLRDGRGAAITRIALGSVAAQGGDTATARQHLQRAIDELARLGDPVATAAALGQRAELEAGGRRFAAAESLYRAALGRLGNRVVPDVSWQIHAGLGEVRAELGATDEAVKELRASIAASERAGSTLRLPEARSGLYADRWHVYQRLATLEFERGGVAASFAVSEAMRARELAELLSHGRIAWPADAGADLVSREQDLRRRVDELTRAVEGGAPEIRPSRGSEVPASSAVSREALLQAQAEYTALRLEIRDRAPRHAALVAADVADWRTVAASLGRDEAMVEYLLGEDASFAYLITRDTLVGIRLGVTHHEVARRVDFVRAALEPRGNTLDSLWSVPLRRLHRELVEPLEATGLLAGRTRLTIIPHAELHYLPFAALIENDRPRRFLVQRYQLSFAPSASVWVTLDKLHGKGRGVGTLAMAPYLDRLPASRKEVAVIARTSRDVLVATGSAASEAAFRREAPGRRVIHLATYGVLNKQNPLFSFVDLARDPRNDGRLEAHEVFGLRLVADLVVLAACQTGLASGARSDVPAGDDWVGLSRAFLTAGAKRVMASLWAVEDRATSSLMQRFYSGFSEQADPGRTLAEAQRLMIANRATAHPYYWAGFAVMGGS